MILTPHRCNSYEEFYLLTKSHALGPSVLYLGYGWTISCKTTENSTPFPWFYRHLFNQLIRSMVKLCTIDSRLTSSLFISEVKKWSKNIVLERNQCLPHLEWKQKEESISVKCSEWVYVCVRKCRPERFFINFFNSMAFRSFKKYLFTAFCTSWSTQASL